MEISLRRRARMTEEKREAKRARQRAAYAADTEKMSARVAAWKAANPDYHRQADRDRYAANPEKFRAKNRAHRQRIKASPPG